MTSYSPVARRWTFTNYRFDDVILETFCEKGLETEVALRYICFGDETCPNTGRRHMQGYCELRSPTRRAGVQELLARLGCDPKCHIEPAVKPREAQRKYCSKDGEFYEAGDWKSGGQGARTDLHPAIELAKTACNAWDLIQAFPNEYCKYSRGLDRIRVLASKRAARTYRPIEVHVLWGDPGTRKTDMTGLNRDHNVFPVACGDTFPFDNYDGEKTIVFDDFYGQLRCADMLSWTNGQYGSVTIKGGSAYRAWTKVYITSNTPPDTWYPNVPDNVRKAFLSRLTTVTHVTGKSHRPETKYFTLNTNENTGPTACNEVDCNTIGVPPLAETSASGIPSSPLLWSIDDPDVIACALEFLDGTPGDQMVTQPTISPGSHTPKPRPKGKARKLARLARDPAALPIQEPVILPKGEHTDITQTTVLGAPPAAP